jgi:hypothetical protein
MEFIHCCSFYQFSCIIFLERQLVDNIVVIHFIDCAARRGAGHRAFFQQIRHLLILQREVPHSHHGSQVNNYFTEKIFYLFV